MRYLGRDVGDPWLFGATGYAFVINITPSVGVDGPTCWNMLAIAERLAGLGVSTENYVSASVHQPGFEVHQEAAWSLVRARVGAGIPCYGCELAFPEFFTLHGFEGEEVLYWTHCIEGNVVRRHWRKLGAEGVGWLFVGSVEPLETRADDRQVVREALAFGLMLNEAPDPALCLASTGLAAYDTWIGEMESGRWVAEREAGVRHNIACWHECRSFAGPFLREAGRRLDGSLQPRFDEAARHYEATAEALAGVAAMFSWSAPVPEPDGPEVPRTVALLKEAKATEAAGLDILAGILPEL
jgi:hypothetical protein